jgi:hypothetical protein
MFQNGTTVAPVDVLRPKRPTPIDIQALAFGRGLQSSQGLVPPLGDGSKVSPHLLDALKAESNRLSRPMRLPKKIPALSTELLALKQPNGCSNGLEPEPRHFLHVMLE